MARINPGLGGRGTVTTIERRPHPPSHFEMHEMRIQKADNGGFVVHHHLQLKKRHENKEDYMGGYKEPETHVVPNPQALMSHMKKHFGGTKVAPAAASPAPDPNDAVEEGEADNR